MADKMIDLAELGKLPDSLIRFGIRQLCRNRLRSELISDPEAQQRRFQTLIQELRVSPIAVETDAANEQHYEVPTKFYLHALGHRLKYSCAYYENDTQTLDQAEEAMLNLYSHRAELENGQSILELGCGWGSLTLWMAEKFPDSTITAVSNSATQKTFIDARCSELGLKNVAVITADINNLELKGNQFDRALSIEMFEHMRNYQQLLEQISGWVKPQGKLFIHIFAHRFLMYPFEVKNGDDWMSRYFFTGGLMPSTDTLLHFQDQFKLRTRWLVNGQHYQRTSNHWLENMDRHRPELMSLLAQTYGESEALRWYHRWRLFFMACAELFGMNKGNDWMVAHFLFDNR